MYIIYRVYWSRSHLGVFSVSSWDRICPGWTMRGFPRGRMWRVVWMKDLRKKVKCSNFAQDDEKGIYIQSSMGHDHHGHQSNRGWSHVRNSLSAVPLWMIDYVWLWRKWKRMIQEVFFPASSCTVSLGPCSASDGGARTERCHLVHRKMRVLGTHCRTEGFPAVFCGGIWWRFMSSIGSKTELCLGGLWWPADGKGTVTRLQPLEALLQWPMGDGRPHKWFWMVLNWN